MIYKRIVIENSEPWPSLLPNCACHNEKGRLILYDNIVYCGYCGVAYGKAGCIGLTLISESKECR